MGRGKIENAWLASSLTVSIKQAACSWLEGKDQILKQF